MAVRTLGFSLEVEAYADLTDDLILHRRLYLMVTVKSPANWMGSDLDQGKELLRRGARSVAWCPILDDSGLPADPGHWKDAAPAEIDFWRLLEAGREIRLDEDDEPAPKPRPIQTIMPDECSVAGYLDKKHDPVKCLLEGSLPRGCVGVAGASGGTGKGFLSAQLGASLAAGLPFFQIWEIAQPYKVFYLSAEESQRTVEIRSAGAIRRLGLNREQELDAAGRFWSKAIHGNVRLIQRSSRGNIEASDSFRDLFNLMNILRPDLLFLDHFAKFFPCSEIDNAELTTCCGYLEELATALDCSVIVLHHVSKSSSGVFAGSKDEVYKALDPANLRGGTGLAACARWVLLMTPLGDTYAPKIIGESAQGENSGVYVAGRVVKKNDGAAEDIFYLKHGPDGFFDQVAASGDDSILGDVARLVEEVGRRQAWKEDPLSKTGGGDVFNWGKGRYNRAVKKAMETGQLSAIKKVLGNGEILAT